MKYFKIIAIVFAFVSCYAQDKQVLLKKEAFTDFSKLPVYSRLTEKENGKTVWKKKYQYLDSITIYTIQ